MNNYDLQHIDNKINIFKQIFDNSLDLICAVYDGTTKLELLNPRWETLLGYTREEITSKNFLEFVHPDDIAITMAELNKLATIGDNLYNFDNRYVTKDNKIVYLNWIAWKYSSYTFAVARNVTENHNYIEAIKTEKMKTEISQIKAEKAFSDKTLFLSKISHELRTPLNSILGFAQLIKEGEDKKQNDYFIDIILQSGNYLLQLIEDISDLSRIETQEISLNIQSVNLYEIIKNTVITVEYLIRKYNIKIEYDDNNLNYFVNVDKKRLTQIILNILTNSLKYNKQNGIVKIYCENMDTYIILNIEDNGIGISKENMKRLFTPFDRLGQENSLIEGTGLGLVIVQKLLDLMKLKYHVKSKENVGTKFSIIMPIVKKQFTIFKQDNNEYYDYEEKEKEKEEKKEDKNYKILYIEDNKANILLLKHIIKKIDPTINFVNVGNDIDKIIEIYVNQKDIDLIFCDFHLGTTNAFEVFVKLKKINTNIVPFIVISADTDKELIENLLNNGISEYILKPYNINIIKNVIKKYRD